MADSLSLTCCVSLEWLTVSGVVSKCVKFKTATLRLVRNEFRDIFLTIQTKDNSKKFLLKGVSVHKKFMHEGKATIKFNELNMNVMISNSPTTELVDFLKVLFIKLTSFKSSPKVPLKSKLVSLKAPVVEEISPVNPKDVNRFKEEKIKNNDPTKKRRLEEKSDINPVRKKIIMTPSSSLNDEQRNVLEAVKRGSNIFFTGSAGTGKSYLLKSILNSLPPDSTVATASTGAAACLIGGVTLHSFAGIGCGDASLEKCKELARRPLVLQGWRRCRHLIIDEISMVDAPFFEKVECIAREVRANEKPFGGIQLIVCGDFLQLPPVSKSKVKFCFDTDTWSRCQFSNFQLKMVHRQSDPLFIDMLNSIRLGIVTPKIKERLQETATQSIEGSGILATRLCCHTKEAKLINDSKLESLPGTGKLFEAQDSSEGAQKILDECSPVEKRLRLKIGAQVMLLKNVDLSKGLVNGARGVVEKFGADGPIVKFVSGSVYTVKPEKWTVKTFNGSVHVRKQIPLRLAWAFSIHKSQGLTLDCVEMCLGKTFEAGQAYVALSRAKSLDSVRVIGFSPSQVWANPEVLRFYRNLNCYVPEYIPLGPKRVK